MPNLAYKQPALQRNKPMDYAKPAGAKGKGSSMKKKSTIFVYPHVKHFWDLQTLVEIISRYYQKLIK